MHALEDISCLISPILLSILNQVYDNDRTSYKFCFFQAAILKKKNLKYHT